MTRALPTPGFSIPDKSNPSGSSGAAEFHRGAEERRGGEGLEGLEGLQVWER